MSHPQHHAEALDRLLEIGMLLGRDSEEHLAKLGLTVSRAHLCWVLRREGPVSQRAIAQALDVSARNVTGLVDALVDSGFVTRDPDPDDRRATLIALTPHGEQTLATMEDEHRELARTLFADLSDRRFATLAGGLDHIRDALIEAMEAADEPAD